MPLLVEFQQLLVSLACALTVSAAVNFILRRTFKVPEDSGVRLSDVEHEDSIGRRSSGGPTFAKDIHHPLRQVLISALRWLFLHLDSPGIEASTHQEELRTPRAPRIVPVDLPTLSPLQFSRSLVPCTPTGAMFQVFDNLEFQAPDGSWILPQELSPLSPFQSSEWPSPVTPVGSTLLEFNSPETQDPGYALFDNLDTDNETELTFERFMPSTSSSPVRQEYGIAPYTVTAKDEIVINMSDALTAEITIHGGTYDPVALRSHLEYMKSQSHERQQPINLDIVSACENVADAYFIIEGILDNCKDHVGSLSITMGAFSTFLDFENTSIGSRLPEMLTFPNLLHFSWSGDATYLPRPWGSLPKLPFAELESLTLDCQLSVTDCAQILSSCDRIVHFAASSVQDCPPVMWDCSATSKEIGTLRSLKMSASVEVGWLFSFLNFHSLENVDFQFTWGTNTDLADFNIPWADLTSLKLQCHLDAVQYDEIRRKCHPLTHIQLPVLVRDN